MNTHDKKDEMTLTLVEAIETLSNIADLKFDSEVGIVEPHDLVLNDRNISYRTVHWLHQSGSDEKVNMVKETFRVILNYLQNFYKKQHTQVTDNKTIENIKSIMVLVGEAAKKLDKYKTFKSENRKVTELKEYKQLQEFYLNRVAKKIDEGTISRWILALSKKRALPKQENLAVIPQKQFTKHVFIDLEAVKKDIEYELFFLKKEDGSRFFSPRLIRNIKLVSDFGNYLEEEKEESPLSALKDWQDKVAFACAKNIMRATRNHAEKFYRVLPHVKEHELAETLNKALMALMMAGNMRHLAHHTQAQAKSCSDYFYDFQVFLRRCLKSTEYQKLMAYSTDKSHKAAYAVANLMHFICMALYTQLSGYQEFISNIHELIVKATNNLSSDHKEALRKGHLLWSKLAGDYAAMARYLKRAANGPLNRILTKLEAGDCQQFDPLLQDNLPSQLFSLYFQDNKVQFSRWPSPTSQEYINKAYINEEFKALMYGCAHEHTVNKVLLINFQDRVTWKEIARSQVIEDMPNHESFAKHLSVVTLPKDTEFYYQLAPFSQDNHADVFINHFKQQISDKNGGFYFPEALRKELLRDFIPGALETVHRIFFSGKNVLLREQRLDFIEIFYALLELKIIESLKPDHVGFSCKDGLDVTSAAGAELFAFFKLINQERLSENDQEHLDLMLYGPSLISRERIMIPDRFNRLVSALKTIELVREQFGQKSFEKIIHQAFGHLYRMPILRGKVIVQSNKDVF